MITNSDLNISNEGYVKKDFYQVYPEIVELVQLLSTVWDPENTNESDPGVVLLKLDAFLTDKLNYNIDKNILEAFITSATQEEAVRKICEMMGYDMKYYNSATTKIYFMWTGDQLDKENEAIPNTKIVLPKFETVITNDTNDISYVLTKTATLTNRYVTVEATAIEGELVDLSINSDNIINVSNIDDNNRFYLPEKMIAENGIWIYNANDNLEWTKSVNLNTELKGKRVWKFGYDSTKNLPYIQFPDDYASLFNEGIYIKYIRTSGASGNIKANILTKLANANVAIKNNVGETIENNVDSTQYLTIKNLYATNNGCDVQTINEAYNGYKKTVGTFQTLVSCRDYANAIYNMVVDEHLDNTPLVSNCQVSDIRNELNFAKTVAEYGSLGTIYKNISDKTWKDCYVKIGVTESNGQALLDKINDFDLFLYPLNPIKNAYTKNTYEKSFKPLFGQSEDILFELKDRLDEYKTISHKLKHVKNEKEENTEPLYLYKNYYKLKAKIITNNKVNKFEITQIKDNIYQSLYKNFNSRQLDYGEEIPYDILLNVIQNADARIKMVLLDEPNLTSFYMLADGTENQLRFDSTKPESEQSKQYLNYIAKNVLAGKVPLFNYNNQIDVEFNSVNADSDIIYGGQNTYSEKSSGESLKNKNSITYISTYMELICPNEGETIRLGENESLQLVAPKLINKETYPMYVNYYITVSANRQDKTIKANTPFSLAADEALYINYTDTDGNVNWIKYCTIDGKPKKQTWIGSVLSKTVDFSGILEANIDLVDSEKEESSGKHWAKKNPNDGTWPSSFTMAGLFSLKPSQEIYIKGTSKASIKQPAYIYWLSNANNTLIFTKENSNDDTYYCILNDGEYFFYTNQAKTDLLTLGPGTKLTYHPSSVESGRETITWSLNKEQSITTDDIAQNGIGAFANSDWIPKNWDDYIFLETEQMDTLTLGYKDIIEKLELTGGVTTLNSSKWYDLNNITYTQGTTTDSKKSIPNILKWRVRPILNINLGPNKYQELDYNHNHKISIYTSWYSEVDGGSVPLTNEAIIKLLETDPSKLVDHIYTEEAIETFESDMITNICVQSNMNVQKSGGSYISVHTIDINGSNKDNILLYSLLPATPISKINGSSSVIDVKSGISVTTLAEDVDSNYALLPIYIPDNNYDLFTFYYSSQVGGMNIEVANADGQSLNYNILTEFKDLATKSPSSKLEELGGGLHIIKISKPDESEYNNDYYESGDEYESGDVPVYDSKQLYLKITAQDSDSKGELWVLSERLVDFEDELNETSGGGASGSDTGVNYKLFKFDVNQCKNFLNNYIIKPYPDFYSTINIENSMLLDVKDMSDPKVLFDSNNIINKFVLAELSTDFSDIEIASSSKL